MGISVKFPDSCVEATLREGQEICKTNGFHMLPESVLPDGKTMLLQGKVCDSFCFVDHPQVELDLPSATVTRFQCDCPDYRMNRSFCAHCAALVLAMERKLDIKMVEQTPVEEPAQAPVQVDAAPIPELKEFSYSFCNSSWDLYPGVKEPRIPQARYIEVFGNNARAKMLYRTAGLWGGSCYGMVATATLLRQSDGGTEPADFNSTAKIPSQLKLKDRSQSLNMTLHHFIEAMHVLQSCKSIYDPMVKYLYDPLCMETLAKRVAAFQQGQGDPVVMDVWMTPRYDMGHAVLPYRIESISPTKDKLHIYDPNWPMQTRYAYFEKDEQGHYLNWRFPMNDHKEYNSKNGSQLSMEPYELYKKAWDNRGTLAVDNLLNVAAGVALYAEDGTLLVRVTDNGVESFKDDIYQIPKLHGNADSQLVLSLPAGAYTLRLEDPQQDKLTAMLAGTDLSVTIATDAREASVCVDDSQMLVMARILTPGCHYNIEILNTAAEVHEEAVLMGMTGETGLHLMQKDGLLYADGLTERTALFINEEQADLDRIAPMHEENEQTAREELLLCTESDKKQGESEA